MSENAFEFIRVDRFLDDMNRPDKFDTELMDGMSLNYKFLLCSEVPSVNIEDCLDEDGTLVDDVVTIDTNDAEDGLCALLWSKGVNGERTLSVASSTVQYSFDDVVNVQAIFLVEVGSGTGYVIAYSIIDKAIEIDTTDLLCPVEGVAWTIRYED